MKKLPLSLATITLLGSLPPVTQAQSRPEMLERLFSQMDRNNDGLIEQGEAPPQLWSKIIAGDSDGDGKISKQEGAQAVKSLAGQMGGRPEADRMREIFARLAKDGEGKISLAELPPPMRQRLAKLDKNKDQFIDRDEFKAAPLGEMFAGSPGATGERMLEMLKRFDTDNDGKLDLEDLPEPIRERMEPGDTNADGLIDQAELKALVAKTIKSAQAAGPGRAEGKKAGDRPAADNSTAPQQPKRPASSPESTPE